MHRNYIAGQWVDALSGETFASTNPANGELIGEAPKGGREDVEKAVAAAAEAFAKWRKVPAPKRGEMLFRVARLLEQNKERLAQLLTREMGKVIAEARGDVQEAIDMAYYMGGEGRRLFGYTAPVELPEQVRHGVARSRRGGRGGHPLELPHCDPKLEDPAGARRRQHGRLQARFRYPDPGDRVRAAFRGSRAAAGRAEHRDRAGRAVGEALVAHPAVKVVTFTGTTEAGKRVSALAAPTLEEGLPGAGRQERDHRHGRRRPRPGARRHPVVGVRHDRAALHRLLAGDRAEGRPPGAGRPAGRAHREAAPGRWAAARRRTSARSSTGGRWREFTSTSSIGQAEGRTCWRPAARSAADGDLAKGNFYTPTIFDDVRPRCGSRRKRSSARC